MWKRLERKERLSVAVHDDDIDECLKYVDIVTVIRYNTSVTLSYDLCSIYRLV